MLKIRCVQCCDHVYYKYVFVFAYLYLNLPYLYLIFFRRPVFVFLSLYLMYLIKYNSITFFFNKVNPANLIMQMTTVDRPTLYRTDRLTKRTVPEYGPPLASPQFFPIHIMYYQIQKADRFVTPTTLFQSQIITGHKKRTTPDAKKNNSHFTV